jgi:4'-phosphopantetheinyl transferase EntD
MDPFDTARLFPEDTVAVFLDRFSAPSPEIFPEEEALLPKSVSPTRADGFRLGRHAAHLALANLDLRPRPILRGAGGEPIWPAGVVGSISHSGDRAIAVVALSSTSAGIGVDMEDRDRYFAGLEAEIASSEELAALEAIDPAGKISATLETFSAKESIYKAHYPQVRRFFGFDAARIEFVGDVLTGYFTQPLVASYPTDRPMEIGKRWAGQHLLTWLVLPPD